jgi:2,3-bisphosphoglycerate-independent phosphoglycerate mutase
MRRVVFVVPEWLSADADDSLLRQHLPTLQAMAELGTLTKLSPQPPVETPESLWLGLPPDMIRLAQGPLTISALGADPPERSTHFHASLMSFEDGVARRVTVQVPDDQVAVITRHAERLNTKALTFVAGEGLDHGLVWEALGDLGTTPPADVDGKPVRDHLPEGDADRPLRLFIDDSINLLSELELNQERTDQGLPLLNLLWPWGHGVRKPVPNLALRRGEPATVLSSSMRMQGLTRLVGYRHGDRHSFGRGLGVKLEHLAGEALKSDLAFVVLDFIPTLREREKLEEANWLTREIDRRFLTPIFESALKSPTRISVVAPSIKSTGLAVSFATGQQGANTIPFDERAREERSLPTRDAWSVIEEGTQSIASIR